MVSKKDIENSNAIHDNIRSSRPEVCSIKKGFLEISQNSQENTSAKDSF